MLPEPCPHSQAACSAHPWEPFSQRCSPPASLHLPHQVGGHSPKFGTRRRALRRHLIFLRGGGWGGVRGEPVSGMQWSCSVSKATVQGPASQAQPVGSARNPHPSRLQGALPVPAGWRRGEEQGRVPHPTPPPPWPAPWNMTGHCAQLSRSRVAS